MLQNALVEHSAVPLTCIKIPNGFQAFVLSFFEWPLKAGFTVYVISYVKGVILLRRESSLKSQIFLTVSFAIIFVTMNGHTYKLFKNRLSDVQTEGKSEINTA